MSEYESAQAESRIGLQERYRALYEPAAASKRVIEYMAKHPFCDRSVLRNATNIDGIKEDYPEIVHLAGAVLDTRTQVERTYTELSELTGQRQKRIATVLFESAQEGEIHPAEGKLEMGFLDNPFALVLVADEVDFKYLDSRDVAGHYNKSLQVRTQSKQFTVSFIAIKNGTTLSKREILEHEEGHAHNACVKQSLDRVGKNVLWGSEFYYKKELWNVASNLHHAWEVNVGNGDRDRKIKLDSAWTQAMSHSLSRAKDEIIVRLNTWEEWESLYKQGGIYDYFLRDFDMRGNNAVEKMLWENYLSIIKSEIHIARKTQGLYKELGLYKKAEILPWMLMRIPLGSWKNELNAAGLTSETELISKIIKRRSEINRSVSRRFRKLMRSSAALEEESALKNVQNNQENLLVPELLEYLQNLGKS